MKPKTWTLPKFRALAERLDIGEPFAAGILEALYHLASTFDPDSGHLPTKDPVELTAGWRLQHHGLEPVQVVDVLIERGWLELREGQLCVQDWHQERPAYLSERLRKRNWKRQSGAPGRNGDGKSAAGDGRKRHAAPSSATAAPSDSMSAAGAADHMIHMMPEEGQSVELTEAETADYARAVFQACGHKGDGGRQLWKAAAMWHCGLISESDWRAAAEATAAKSRTNKPAYFYKAIRQRVEHFDQLAQRVRIIPDWPDVYPGD